MSIHKHEANNIGNVIDVIMVVTIVFKRRKFRNYDNHNLSLPLVHFPSPKKLFKPPPPLSKAMMPPLSKAWKAKGQRCNPAWSLLPQRRTPIRRSSTVAGAR